MIQYLFLNLVRIIGTFSQENNFSLAFDEKNFDDARSKLYKGRFIILEPEIIISSTSIITAEPWPRVPLLRELFKKSECIPDYQLAYGNTLHLVFRRIIENTSGKFASNSLVLYPVKDEEKIMKIIHECMQEQLVSLYIAKGKHSEESIIKHLNYGNLNNNICSLTIL